SAVLKTFERAQKSLVIGNLSCSPAGHPAIQRGEDMSPDFGVSSRFIVGNRVSFVGPGFHNGDDGEVVAVLKGFDGIYRYMVHFSDANTSDACFGSELQLNRTEVLKCA